MVHRVLRPQRVLVVDDEASIRELFVELLSTLPVEVEAACCVDEAIEKLSRAGFTLVITDLNMPGGRSGLDLMEAVRQDFPGTRIGVISGSSGEGFKERMIDYSPDFFMEKPLDITAFLQKVSMALEGA